MWVLFMLREIFYDLVHQSEDRLSDKVEYVVLREKQKGSSRLCNQDLEQKTTAGELKVGDIVLMKCNQVAPADLLLLDTPQMDSNNAICYVDYSYTHGFHNYHTLHACKLTQT